MRFCISGFENVAWPSRPCVISRNSMGQTPMLQKAQQQPANKRSGFFSLPLLILLLLSSLVSAKDPLVDSSSRNMWVTVAVAGEASGTTVSLIFARALGSDQWQQLYQIASPIVSLTHQGDQPVILLNNGQWMFVYPDGRTLGNDVPAAGRLVQIAGDGKNICGAAWIDGGIKGLSSTRPTTTTTTTPATTGKLVLLRYVRAQWQGIIEIPDVPSNAEVSLAGADGNLLLVWHEGKSELRGIEWSPAAGAQPLPAVTAKFQISDFKALFAGDQPMVWFAPATGAGTVGKWERGNFTPIDLPSHGGLAQSQDRDVCVDADQQFRLIYEQNDEALEQNYDAHGALAGNPQEILNQPQDQNDLTSNRLMEFAAVALLVFVILSTLRRQQTLPPQMPEGAPLRLASFARRFGAGILDLLPTFIAAMLTVSSVSQPVTTYEQAMRIVNDPAIRGTMQIATGFYLLHTTLGELFFGRSIGKFIFGLKVVNLHGERPSPLAIIIRNFCRIFEVPLFLPLILILPLRQRIGDLAGGTIVVMAKGTTTQPTDQTG